MIDETEPASTAYGSRWCSSPPGRTGRCRPSRPGGSARYGRRGRAPPGRPGRGPPAAEPVGQKTWYANPPTPSSVRTTLSPSGCSASQRRGELARWPGPRTARSVDSTSVMLLGRAGTTAAEPCARSAWISGGERAVPVQVQQVLREQLPVELRSAARRPATTWSWMIRCSARYRSGERRSNSASSTSRARSCGVRPAGRLVMNGRPLQPRPHRRRLGADASRGAGPRWSARPSRRWPGRSGARPWARRAAATPAAPRSGRGRRRGSGHGAGRGHVGQQGQGQRVPAAEPQQLLVGRRGDAGAGEQRGARRRRRGGRAGGRRRRAASPGRCARRRPAARGRPAPRRRRRAGPGSRSRRSQPSIGAELLVAVDQQHRRASPPVRPRRSAAWKPSGDGSTSRPSSSATVRPAARARARNSSSSVVLPMPPGPCTNSTRRGDRPASASSKLASSRRRPTKPCRRALSKRSPRLTASPRSREPTPPA